jgi:hypothetical protein
MVGIFEGREVPYHHIPSGRDMYSIGESNMAGTPIKVEVFW